MEVIETQSLKINDVLPKVVAQKPPYLEEKFKRFGRMVGACQKIVAEKPQLKIDRTEFSQCALFLEVEGQDRPKFIFEIDRNGEVQ
eukprot:4927027-Karenia_brevis.AAC.1